ncbi:MAG: hypothetical protein NTY00_07525 [Deltaproteobacteria bacterium]|nr:hypothetical protein [Deltaproteobacteria bacterium]
MGRIFAGGPSAVVAGDGVARIIVDLSHCGAASSKGRQVLAALASDQPLPETLTFNYLQGLS